jgi:thiol-disulfide isomerase/thioredoxin
VLKRISKNIITNKPYLKAVKYGLFVFFAIISHNSSAYNIKVEIENCPDYIIYFGKHVGPDFEIIDSIQSVNGNIEFSGDKKLETGVYFIVIPPQTRFDFIIADNQDFTIKTNTRDILGKLQINGEKQYQIFVDLQKMIASINKQRSQLEMELNFFKMYQKDTVGFVESKIDSLNNVQSKLYSEFKNKVEPGLFLHKILNILEPFSVPDSIKAIQYSNPAEHYKYYIDHYLDRVDFTDDALLNTPEFVFHKQLTDYCYYFFDVRSNKVDEVFNDIDRLIEKTGNNQNYQRYILTYLISRYENPSDLRLEAILVYVYRNYFLISKPEWISQQAFEVMKFRIEGIQYNLIGEIGKNLTLHKKEGEKFSIHDNDSTYKVLIFWEPECELCIDAVKQLKSEYDKLKTESIEVIAINTNKDDIKSWLQVISDNQLDWINAYDPDNSSNFEQYYGTYKTPRLFILDNSNKIITKDIKPEYVYNYIISHKKQLEKDRGRFDFMFGQ